jgi:hypothetical protein
MVVVQATTMPSSKELGSSWPWLISTCLFGLAAPIALVNVPILLIQNHALAAVPRERLRGVLAANRYCIGMGHGISINIFQIYFAGSVMRIYAIYNGTEGYGPFALLTVGSYVLGVIAVLLIAWPTIKMYFSVWQPWDQCTKAVIDGTAESMEAPTAQSGSNTAYGSQTCTPAAKDVPMASKMPNGARTVSSALEQADLSSYDAVFCAMGYDNMSDLEEMAAAADQSGFEEALAAVGMAEKPGHVRRLKKILLHSA